MSTTGGGKGSFSGNFWKFAPPTSADELVYPSYNCNLVCLVLRHRALDNILLDCYSWPLDHNQWTDTAHDSIFFFIFSTSSPPNRTGSVQFRALISRKKPQDLPRDAPAVGAALNFFSHWPNFDLAPRVRGQWNDWRRTLIIWSNFIIDNGV